jgi:hypothetical protein
MLSVFGARLRLMVMVMVHACASVVRACWLRWREKRFFELRELLNSESVDTNEPCDDVVPMRMKKRVKST